MRQVVLDTETTGLRYEEGHRVIEIGCVELINRRMTGNHFHCYLNPEREIDDGAMAVHGITNVFLKDKPLFSDVVSEFMSFIQNAELIIHNAPFDVGFLNNELVLTKQNFKMLTDYCKIIDTLPLARQLHVGQRNSLDALCKRYFIDNSKRDLHGALLDANLLARVYLAMTGGQGSFFDAMTEVVEESGTSTGAAAPMFDLHDLLVLEPTEAEAEEHEQYLSMMSGKGKCLWTEN